MTDLFVDNDYSRYDGLGLAQLVRDKEITALELLENAIAQAEKFNPQLNCITNKLYDYARAAIAAGLPQGPFHGVPFLLKDLGTMCAGTVTSHGSRLFNKPGQQNSPLDSEVVKRFKAAGLVIFGKTNSPEFGLSFVTESLASGPCRNPWDVNRTPGGSSGGAAAAVSAGILPIAHANDGGGSIRVPASCCGLFGLKPTRARVPAGPLVGEGWGGLVSSHIVSNSVRDSAAMLDIISGAEIGDPYYAPHKANSYLEKVTAVTTQQKGPKLKIAFTTRLNRDAAPDPEIQKVFEKTIKLCEQLGHELSEDQPAVPHEQLRVAFQIIAASNAVSLVQMTERELGRPIKRDELEPMTWEFIEFGRTKTAADYVSAVFQIQLHSRTVGHFFERYDLLLTPTTAKLPVAIGKLSGNCSDFDLYNAKQLAFAPYTAIANITGQPAMSVPLWWSADKSGGDNASMPIGMHFIGRFGDEATLFQLAAQLEQAQPWQDRKALQTQSGR